MGGFFVEKIGDLNDHTTYAFVESISTKFLNSTPVKFAIVGLILTKYKKFGIMVATIKQMCCEIAQS